MRSEAFSSCVCLADLQGVDGLGELSGAPGAGTEHDGLDPLLAQEVEAILPRHARSRTAQVFQVEVSSQAPVASIRRR
jgi:hypothetical protein